MPPGAKKVKKKRVERRTKSSPSGARAASIRCVSSYEREARERGFTLIAGVDEVGRGCLFGPVFAAAVILDPDKPVRALRDSKIVEAEERQQLAALIKSRSMCWAVAGADPFEIDQVNILQASRLAMRRAVEGLSRKPDYLLIDAITIDLPIEQLPLIDGDARCRAIAAASILAKVHRDACLAEWDRVFPQYNLASNKGYSTPDHRRALRLHGPTLLHRFSFEPVRASSPHAYWTGYLNNDPVQESLFAELTEGVPAEEAEAQVVAEALQAGEF